MADIAQLTPDLFITGQPERDDFERLRAQGFGAVINNRPDGEPGPDYVTAEEAATLAAEHGLAYAHLPVQGPDLLDPAVAKRFGELLETLPKPIVAHCKSGMRSAALWALAVAGTMPTEQILRQAAAARVDLSRLAPLIEARANENGGSA